jgi:hypothetical protein
MLEDGEEKKIGVQKRINTQLLRGCIKTQIVLFQRLKNLCMMSQV